MNLNKTQSDKEHIAQYFADDPDRIKLIRNRFYIAISTITTMIIAGTIVFHYLEHWSWIDAFYFIVVTSATVGYGDFVPTTELTRLIAAIFILVMVPFILYSFTIMAQILLERKVIIKTHNDKVNQK